jgi:tRNA(Ile)-lysidine synthase
MHQNYMKLLKTIPNRLNLDHNANYLLACSFGPDSMALFNMLLTEKYNFSVAFVNYKTRSNSDYEEEELEKICLKNNIAFH